MLEPPQDEPQTLPAPLYVMTRSVAGWWREWVNLMAINVVWAFFCMSVIFAPPAIFGLFYVANRLAHKQDIGVAHLLQAGQRHFLKSWLWALLNLIALLLLLANLWFYGQLGASWQPLVWALVGLSVTVWLAVQAYALAYFMEQEEPRLRQALKNGLLTVLASPLYTLLLMAFMALVVTISIIIVPLLFLGGPCLLAVTCNQAVLERLQAYGKR